MIDNDKDADSLEYLITVNSCIPPSEHLLSVHSSVLWISRMNELNEILGTAGLERMGDKYLLKVIDQDCWKKILYFARKHKWINEMDDKWNIFNVVTENRLYIMPKVEGKADRKIAAILTVEPIDNFNRKLNLYWELDYNFKKSGFLMLELFNSLKERSVWKADYVKEWLDNELINAANEFYERNILKNKDEKNVYQLLKMVGDKLKKYFK